MLVLRVLLTLLGVGGGFVCLAGGAAGAMGEAMGGYNGPWKLIGIAGGALIVISIVLGICL